MCILVVVNQRDIGCKFAFHLCGNNFPSIVKKNSTWRCCELHITRCTWYKQILTPGLGVSWRVLFDVIAYTILTYRVLTSCWFFFTVCFLLLFRRLVLVEQARLFYGIICLLGFYCFIFVSNFLSFCKGGYVKWVQRLKSFRVFGLGFWFGLLILFTLLMSYGYIWVRLGILRN